MISSRVGKSQLKRFAPKLNKKRQEEPKQVEKEEAAEKKVETPIEKQSEKPNPHPTEEHTLTDKNVDDPQTETTIDPCPLVIHPSYAFVDEVIEPIEQLKAPPKIVSSRRIEEPQSKSPEPDSGYETKKEQAELSESEIPIQNMSLSTLIKSKFARGKSSQFALHYEQTKKEQRKMARLRRKGLVEQVASPSPSPLPTKSTGPKLRIVDGGIQLDQDSLQVNTQQEEQDHEVVDDRDRYITSASFGRKAHRMRWDKESTNQFYQGLSLFGTDFTLISIYIRATIHEMNRLNLDRKHIRLKYCQETKVNPNKVTFHLINKQIADTTIFDQMKQVYTKMVDLDKTKEQEKSSRNKESKQEECSKKDECNKQDESEDCVQNECNGNMQQDIQQESTKNQVIANEPTPKDTIPIAPQILPKPLPKRPTTGAKLNVKVKRRKE